LKDNFKNFFSRNSSLVAGMVWFPRYELTVRKAINYKGSCLCTSISL